MALATLVVFGAHAFVWGTTSTVVRQRAVPDELLGRVTGVYRVAIIGGLVIGTPIGGLLARAYGITAPFWFGFIGSALLVAVLWRHFDNIVHAGREWRLSDRRGRPRGRRTLGICQPAGSPIDSVLARWPSCGCSASAAPRMRGSTSMTTP